MLQITEEQRNAVLDYIANSIPVKHTVNSVNLLLNCLRDLPEVKPKETEDA